MKIIQLTYSLSSGGGERFLVDLSNELCTDNEVFIIQILSNDNLGNSHYLPDLDSRITYLNLDCKSGVSFDVLGKVYKTIKRINPDVVHVHCSLLTIAMATLLFPRPKYFHTIHSSADRCLGSKYYKPLFKLLYKRKVQAVTISTTSMASYDKLYNLSNSVCITNGRSQMITTDKFDLVSKEVSAFKVHGDDKIFLHVARYHPIKNQQLLFKTFQRLNSEGEHVQLIVIGNGFDLSALAAYNTSPVIHLLGEKRNVADYLAVSDFFVLSSKMEGLPISLLEAMSMGVIPVSTPAGGVCDVIINGTNGYVSKTHAEEDFYITIKEAIYNVSKISSTKVIDEYLHKYSMTSCANSYRRLFEEARN